ncbi:MAG: hypothetical protein NC924_05805 [Candidatus Omnitrophica bacterium]|nr:hypothetical protein [Candidatus Omnitrophota bacterium]
MEQPPRTIIIGVTGGIGAYKACDVVRALRKKDYPVQVVMSAAAERFVTRLSLQTLSGNPVAQDLFSTEYRRKPGHIALADQAAVIAVVPATAHTIAKLAGGFCDDLLSCVITASRASVLICPAMNDRMYQHPAVQANIRRLQEFNYSLLLPVEGDLACGRRGIGHLADVAEITKEIERLYHA